MQTDVKKLVAYRRVSHITFIILGLVSRNKTLFLRVLILSLAHGWASMGIFAGAGLISQTSSSRLGILASIEGKLRVLSLLIGLFLLSNASIPPLPSFFPELRLVLAAGINRGIIIFLFLFLSVFVCYYNAYIFVWASHIKRVELISRRQKKIELDKMLLLLATTFISLI
jgi:NADH:ubiquinone oxidoreductase subunit 4 (subunit M)